MPGHEANGTVLADQLHSLGYLDEHLPSACRNLVDPLGAGDQFIAALAYQRSLELDWRDAIALANIAAGLQCERSGCVPLTTEEVCESIAKAVPAPQYHPFGMPATG